MITTFPIPSNDERKLTFTGGGSAEVPQPDRAETEVTSINMQAAEVQCDNIGASPTAERPSSAAGGAE